MLRLRPLLLLLTVAVGLLYLGTTQQGEPAEVEKVVIVVTPTYERIQRAAEMNKMSALLRGHAVFWIVIEDAPRPSRYVTHLLQATGLPYAYLAVESSCRKYGASCVGHHKGVEQRNLALAYVEQHNLEGVVYFADDDNVFEARMLPCLQHIHRVGVFSVGLIGTAGWEGPRISDNKVVGWQTNERSWADGRNRPFQVDMAGIGISSRVFLERKGEVRFRNGSKSGWLESDLLLQFVESLDELETPCSELQTVLVWHTVQSASSYPCLFYPPDWSTAPGAVLRKLSDR